MVRREVKNKKIFTLKELTTWLTASVATARRRLAQWKAHTSYNKNGRFYTLPEIPTFNSQGLWQHQEVFFSQYGNLVQTVIGLVEASEAGIAGHDLGNALGMQTRSFLAPFRHRSELHREKIAGRWIWFSGDEQRQADQRRARLTCKIDDEAQLPSDAEAVQILAELIRSPRRTPETLARYLASKGIRVSSRKIEALLRHHDLVKKTADSLW